MRTQTRTFDFEYWIADEDGGEVCLTIEADFRPGCPASGPRGERPTNPPEPATIEITSITLNGDDFDATASQLDDITEDAWNHIPSRDDEY
jgi:hypothetical protein